MEKSLKQLTKHIYYLPHDATTDRPILAAICGKNQTLLIDAGNSSNHAKQFLNALSQHAITNYYAVVLTHWHWDHSFGAHQMNRLTIAHESTKTYLEKITNYHWSDQALAERVEQGIEHPFCAEMIQKEYGVHRNIVIVPPNITFQEKLKIDLGDITCTIHHIGGDHSSDASIIFVEEEQVLFLGDCLYPSIYTEKPLYTIENVRRLLKIIESFKAEIYVLSHEHPLTKNEFIGYRTLLKIICDLTEKHQGNDLIVKQELSQQFDRKLSTLEEEIIACFINAVEDAERNAI